MAEVDEEKEQLRWAVERLPQDCRMVTRLHYKQGLPLAEISRIFRLTPEEVERQMEEAARLLPALMREKRPAEPEWVSAAGFRHLLSPEIEVLGRSDPQPCITCGEKRPGFALFVHRELYFDTHYVCDECIRDARPAEQDLRFQDSDRRELRRQLAALRSDLSVEAREKLASERIREVESGTPRPPILQPFDWPAHCGEFYGFVKWVRREDLIALDPEGDGKAFFRRHVAEIGLTDGDWVDERWEDGFGPDGFINAYLWRCLECGNYLITWDHD